MDEKALIRTASSGELIKSDEVVALALDLDAAVTVAADVPVSLLNAPQAASAEGAIQTIEKAIADADGFFNPALATLRSAVDAVRDTRNNLVRAAQQAGGRLRASLVDYNARLRREQEAAAKQAVAQGTPADPQIVQATLPGNVGVRTTWQVEITDMKALAGAVAAGDAPTEVFKANTTFLRSMARASGGRKPIPGVRFYKRESAVVRRNAQG